jgi:hypothetical protein
MFRRPAEYNYYLHHLFWRHPLSSPTAVLAMLHSNGRSLFRNTELYNELSIVRCQFVYEVANYVNVCVPNLNAMTNQLTCYGL